MMGKSLFDTNKPLVAILVARPEARVQDVKKLAPSMAHLPDAAIEPRN